MSTRTNALNRKLDMRKPDHRTFSDACDAEFQAVRCWLHFRLSYGVAFILASIPILSGGQVYAQQQPTRVAEHVFDTNASSTTTDPRELALSDGHWHRIDAAVANARGGLTIRGLRNARLDFRGEIQATVATKNPWQNDRGVINFVDCEDIEVHGLNVTNRFTYRLDNAVGQQESTALCLSRCRNVLIADASLRGQGKAIVVIHSGSNAQFRNVRCSGYYFELLVGASRVELDRVRFFQFHPAIPDSHAAIWTSSSMRNAETNQLYEGTRITFGASTFDLQSGRGLFSGNGSYETKSIVRFKQNPTIRHRYPAVGIAIFYKNYHSLRVDFEQSPKGIVDLLNATGGRGVSRFIVYHRTPGAPNSRSPIVVDGLSSETVKERLATVNVR